jgi:hypothetical protein
VVAGIGGQVIQRGDGPSASRGPGNCLSFTGPELVPFAPADRRWPGRLARQQTADQGAASAARAARWAALTSTALTQESTVRQAQVDINPIVQKFGDYPIGSLRPSQVKSWITRLKSEELKALYIYALHAPRQIMTDAFHHGLIVKSPSRRTAPSVDEQRVNVATLLTGEDGG